MSVKQNVEIAALRKVYNWLDQDPVNRLPKLGGYIDSYIPAGSTLGGQLEAIKSVLGDSENNWYRLIFSIFTEIDSDVRRTIFENFVINATVRAGEIHDKLTAQYEGSEYQKRHPAQKEKVLYTTDEIGSTPYVRSGEKVGRNDPCPCGSGKKFKKCCMGKGLYD